MNALSTICLIIGIIMGLPIILGGLLLLLEPLTKSRK